MEIKIMELKVTNYEFKSGISKKTNKPYVGLEVTFQGNDRFTVKKLLFFSDMQYQLLGITKPESDNGGDNVA